MRTNHGEERVWVWPTKKAAHRAAFRRSCCRGLASGRPPDGIGGRRIGVRWGVELQPPIGCKGRVGASPGDMRQPLPTSARP